MWLGGWGGDLGEDYASSYHGAISAGRWPCRLSKELGEAWGWRGDGSGTLDPRRVCMQSLNWKQLFS